MEKECLDAFREGNKEKALKLLPKLSNPETVHDHETRYIIVDHLRRLFWTCESSTLLHYAAHHRWGNVCKLLVEKYNCEPTAVDDSGRSPLHIACMFGCEKSVKYLVTLPSVLRRINDKDTIRGQTPLHLACKWCSFCCVIEILLETNAVNITIEDRYGRTPLELLSKYTYGVLSKFADKIDWTTQFPVKSFFSVFLVGNSGAGKSTLAAVMRELATYAPTQHGQISNVEKHTAGIVPTQCRG